MKNYGEGWWIGWDGHNVCITYEDIDPYMGGELRLSEQEWLDLIRDVGIWEDYQGPGLVREDG